MTGIKPTEERLTTLCFHDALGALQAGRLAVAPVRERRLECWSAAGAQQAFTTRAHALSAMIRARPGPHPPSVSNLAPGGLLFGGEEVVEPFQ